MFLVMLIVGFICTGNFVYCKDIDAIGLDLLTEKWTQVLMIPDQVDTATKKLFKILSGLNIFEELGRHRHKEVYIAVLPLLPSGHRTKEAHRSYAKALLQLWLMLSDERDIFLQRLHYFASNNLILFANIKRIFDKSK